MKPKILVSTILLMLPLCFINAQFTITGGCSSVTIAGGIPPYGNNLYVEGLFPTPPTCSELQGSAQAGIVRFYLDQRNTSGGWAQVAGPKYNSQGNSFNNLSHGTYRVRVQVPIKSFNINCPNNEILVYNPAGQLVGYQAYWQSVGTASNTVIVGQTTSSDISYTFVDGGGGNSNPSAFDLAEVAKINASASKNYDRWWLTIFEEGGQQRYKSNDWTDGTIGEFNLSTFWAGGTGWQFESLNSYKVQFAITNTQCPNTSTWTNLDKSFFICPAGSGCRYGTDDNHLNYNLSPNPVISEALRIGNFDPAIQQGYYLTIINMTGQVVKNISNLDSSEIDVSTLPNGTYALSLWDDQRTRVFTEKILIMH